MNDRHDFNEITKANRKESVVSIPKTGGRNVGRITTRRGGVINGFIGS
jgi:hypothetical protein